MENIEENIKEEKLKLFEALLKEDDCGGVCASDFSGFVPENNLNKKKLEGEAASC